LQHAGFFANDKRPQFKKEEKKPLSEDEDGRGHLPSLNQSFPTSEAQRQLWLLAELDRNASASYNVTTSLELRGSLDVYILEKTINQVINRHEALRTQIIEQGELQEVVNEVNIKLKLIDLKDEDNPEATALALRSQFSQKPFDLSIAPLFAVILMIFVCSKPCQTIFASS
jgi:microcystin synthetase protein McyE